MALNKIRLGDYIECSTTNNTNLVYGTELICGVTNDGIFTAPRGNVDDVNLKPYKIVENGAFVYNPSRLDLGSIAYRTEGLCIVSHLYIVFYLNERGKEIIDPTYLFMYFRRNEFLREVTFRNFGSQRPEFNFKKMSDIEINLPDIAIQRKYAAVYSAMLENQRCYEQGLDDLKLACDAYIEQLMRDYPSSQIGNYLSDSDVRNKENLTLDFVRGISTEKLFIPTKANMDGVSLGNYKLVQPGEFAYVADTSRRGDKISLALNESDKPYLVSSISIVFKTNEAFLNPYYLMLFFSRSEFDRYARFNSWGSARETFNWEDMREVRIPIPPIDIQESIAGVFKSYRTRFDINERLKAQLKELCPILIKGSVEDASE